MSLLRKNPAAAIAIKAVLAIVLALRRNIADKLVCGIRVFNLKGSDNLVISHWSLVIGHWLFVIGYWLLVIGYLLLVICYLLFVICYGLLVIRNY
jgi:hypothetical protein